MYQLLQPDPEMQYTLSIVQHPPFCNTIRTHIWCIRPNTHTVLPHLQTQCTAATTHKHEDALTVMASSKIHFVTTCNAFALMLMLSIQEYMITLYSMIYFCSSFTFYTIWFTLYLLSCFEFGGYLTRWIVNTFPCTNVCALNSDAMFCACLSCFFKYSSIHVSLP